jgi:hypothetical protein
MGEWRYNSTSAIDGGECSDSHPGRFTPGTHWIVGWVGLRAGLDAVEYRKIPCLSRESNTDSMAITTELSQFCFEYQVLRRVRGSNERMSKIT